MSHGYEIHMHGNTVNNYVISLCDDIVTRLTVVIILKYIEIKLLGCITQTNMVLQVNYTSKTNKQRHKRDQICGYQRRGVR